MIFVFLPIALLLLIFVWAIFHGKHHYEPMDEETNKDMDVSKEVFKDKTKWFF